MEYYFVELEVIID